MKLTPLHALFVGASLYLPTQVFAIDLPVPLPEPDSLWLFAIGVSGFVIAKLTKRKK